MTQIISNALAQFLANRAPLMAAENPEAIHQMRVALRRLRSALKMFKWVLPEAELDTLRREAQRISKALGPAREWDVLRATIEAMPSQGVDSPVDCKSLAAALEDRRTAAYNDARTAIEGREATLFVLKAQSFLDRRSTNNGPAKPDRSRPAKKFAERALLKLNARVLKRGKGFPGLSNRARHKLRIALKNLRYGTEFFGALFGNARQKQSYINRVSTLQDLLGAQQDAVNTMKTVDQLSAGSDKAAGFIIGWLSRDSAIAEKDIRKAWKKFKKTDLRWC